MKINNHYSINNETQNIIKNQHILKNKVKVHFLKSHCNVLILYIKPYIILLLRYMRVGNHYNVNKQTIKMICYIFLYKTIN